MAAYIKVVNLIEQERAAALAFAEGEKKQAHDQFIATAGGDGSVRIIFAPGHTPGHQMLLLQLENTGPIMLSGDLYHTYGLQDAKFVVAINSDERAPIFEQVDFGIVDDCREFLPVLIEKIKEYREKQVTC